MSYVLTLKQKKLGLLNNYNPIYKDADSLIVSLTACDHVDLCVSVVSNGLIVDSSPPTIGDVYIYYSHLLNQEPGSLLLM